MNGLLETGEFWEHPPPLRAREFPGFLGKLMISSSFLNSFKKRSSADS